MPLQKHLNSPKKAHFENLEIKARTILFALGQIISSVTGPSRETEANYLFNILQKPAYKKSDGTFQHYFNNLLPNFI